MSRTAIIYLNYNGFSQESPTQWYGVIKTNNRNKPKTSG